MTAPRRSVWRVASLVLGLLAVAYAVSLVIGDEEARTALAGVPAPMVGLISVFSLVAIALDSVRYRMVLPDRYRSVIPAWTWHRVFGVGRLFNLVLPQAGGAYRAGHLRLEYGVPVATSYGAVAVTTLLGLALAWIIAGAVVVGRSPLLGGVMAGAGVALVVVMAVMVERFGRHRTAGEPATRLRRVGRDFSAGFLELADRRRRWSVLATSVIGEVAGAAALIAAAAALGVPDPWFTGTAVFAGASVIATVSLTPGGLGLTELAAALTATLIDLSAGTGVLIALAARFAFLIALLVFVLTTSSAERLATRRTAPAQSE